MRASEPGPSGSVLYYDGGGGRPGSPAVGDVRVSFLHLPCTSRHVFTAVGVQRGEVLEPFRYRERPPEGLELGPSESRHFNLASRGAPPGPGPPAPGPAARAAAGLHVDEPTGGRYAALPLGSAKSLAEGEGERLLAVAGAPKGAAGQPEKPLGHQALGFGALALACGLSLEAWRRILHQAVPEVLPGLARGDRGRLCFFLGAFGGEVLLAWRLRVMGFLLMTAGAEIAFWQWQAELALLFGGMFEGALWAAVVVGAFGFSLLTAAAASVFYRPVAALVTLSASVTLFAAIFGKVTLLLAAGCPCVTLAARVPCTHVYGARMYTVHVYQCLILIYDFDSTPLQVRPLLHVPSHGALRLSLGAAVLRSLRPSCLPLALVGV